jgi:serine/threonine protein kinase
MDGENIVADAMFFNRSISDEAKALVCNLIKTNPKERLSAHNALESSWIAKDYSRDSKKLDGVREKAIIRKTMKQQRDSDKVNLERVSMGSMILELTRYGIDFSRNGDGSGFHKSQSVVYDNG